MHIDRLWLTDFRNYETFEATFPSEGLVVIDGENGQGKTNLIEAIGHIATTRSFRGAAPESLVRAGAEKALVRGEGYHAGRALLVESEIMAAGKTRTLVNRQPLRRTRDLEETFLVAVFSPDDLGLVKGGPAGRRNYLDELLIDSFPKVAAVYKDFERVMKQRNTLLRQAGGRVSSDIASTLDVWDEKMSIAGEIIGNQRQSLVEQLQPYAAVAYASLADSKSPDRSARIGMTVVTDWRQQDGGKGLADALLATRATDIARAVTSTGPHRDELALSVDGLPARSHASQGEQRTFALALRLAANQVLAKAAGAQPILLLDDVFSELDVNRSRAVVEQLPKGQAFLTTSTDIPDGVESVAIMHIANGAVHA